MICDIKLSYNDPFSHMFLFVVISYSDLMFLFNRSYLLNLTSLFVYILEAVILS